MNNVSYLKETIEKLSGQMPFKWKVQSTSKGDAKRLWCMCVAYIDARDVIDALNKHCIFGWHRKYVTVANDIYCELGIVMPDGTIQWRSDLGDQDNDTETAKTRSSDAFKRAAVNFGVGGFLYNLEKVYIDGTKGFKDRVVPADASGKELKGNDEITKFINSQKRLKTRQPGDTPEIEGLDTKPAAVGNKAKEIPDPPPLPPEFTKETKSPAVPVDNPKTHEVKPNFDGLRKKTTEVKMEYTLECLEQLTTMAEWTAFFALKGYDINDLKIPKVKGQITQKGCIAYFKLHETQLSPEEKGDLDKKAKVFKYSHEEIDSKPPKEFTVEQLDEVMGIIEVNKLGENDKVILESADADLCAIEDPGKNDATRNAIKSVGSQYKNQLSVTGKRYLELLVMRFYKSLQ